MPPKRRPQIPEKLLEMFREWGRQGGHKRADSLSAADRSKIAKKARAARSVKERGRKPKK